MAPSRASASSATTSRILTRTDRYLLPFLALLFLLNSLDRSNIGNAESAGFTKHAGLEPRDINDAVSAFFVAFVALQPVGAALGKRVGAARWVGGVMMVWGLLTTLMAGVKTREGLLTLRAAIGALEAGFYPTTVFYLSLFYTRYEFAQRLGMFYGQYAVAGAFGGLVSYIVFSIFPSEDTADSKDGWKGYQVLFVLEGVLTMLVAGLAFFWLPAGPGSSWWLSPEEAQLAEKRVLSDRAVSTTGLEGDEESDSDHNDSSTTSDIESTSATAHNRHQLRRPSISSAPLLSQDAILHHQPPQLGSEASLTRRDIYEALTSPLPYIILPLNILSALPATAFSIFLPILLTALGVSPLSANLLSIPPFIFGALSLFHFTTLSDRSQKRIRYILIALGINLTGLVLLIALPAKGCFLAKYIALCILLAGSFIASPLTVAWLSNNIPVPGKRAVVLGINGWGNLAGVVSGWLFMPEYAEEGYKTPFAVTAGAVLLAAVGFAGFRRWLGCVNERRRRGEDGEEGMGRSWLGRWVKGGEVWRGRRGDEGAGFRYGY
ncbi:MFS general substrate transporter [Ascodesmis nigricans]|uniref:MFS general substrate transporter n=1 Tax=Ascodesmis nigricans TaxID=341454 RepID=A0A4S2MR74_9PEZI|nr:MFS general substrate transporter [Ascodesmis nigricans]